MSVEFQKLDQVFLYKQIKNTRRSEERLKTFEYQMVDNLGRVYNEFINDAIISKKLNHLNILLTTNLQI